MKTICELIKDLNINEALSHPEILENYDYSKNNHCLVLYRDRNSCITNLHVVGYYIGSCVDELTDDSIKLYLEDNRITDTVKYNESPLYSLLLGISRNLSRLSAIKSNKYSFINRLPNVITLIYDKVNLSTIILKQDKEEFSVFDIFILNDILNELCFKYARRVQDNKEIIMKIIKNDLFYKRNDLNDGNTNLNRFTNTLAYNLLDYQIDFKEYYKICKMIVSLRRDEIFYNFKNTSPIETMSTFILQEDRFSADQILEMNKKMSHLLLSAYPILNKLFPEKIITIENMKILKEKKVSDFFIDWSAE